MFKKRGPGDESKVVIFPGNNNRTAAEKTPLEAATNPTAQEAGIGSSGTGMETEEAKQDPQTSRETQMDLLLKNFSETTLAAIRRECVDLMNNNKELQDANLGAPGAERPDEAQVIWNSAAKNQEFAQLAKKLKDHAVYGISFLHSHFPDLHKNTAGGNEAATTAKSYLEILANLAADLEKPNITRWEVVTIAQRTDQILEPHAKVSFLKPHKQAS